MGEVTDRYQILEGDSAERLKELPDNSVDSIVCDPPAGISFMVKEWDDDKGGRDAWIAWLTDILEEALRVLKPGGHALFWAIPRTSHWTAMAVENAGFEIRDRISNAVNLNPQLRAFLESLDEEQQQLFLKSIPDDSYMLHVFGSGFPKNLDVSKELDRVQGAERKVVGTKKGVGGENMNDIVRGKEIRTTDEDGAKGVGAYGVGAKQKSIDIPVTAPATPEAEKYDGWGTALTPAVEFWIMARKPFSEKNLAKNVLKWGTGGINVDGCRIDVSDEDANHRKPSKGNAGANSIFGVGGHSGNLKPKGRWPKHFILQHTEECELVGSKTVKATSGKGGFSTTEARGFISLNASKEGINHIGYADENGNEVVQEWHCADGCPVAALDEQSGVTKGTIRRPTGKPIYQTEEGSVLWNQNQVKDTTVRGHKDSGGASRFFNVFGPDTAPGFLYAPKAATKEKEAGCEELPEKKRDVGRKEGRPGGDNPRNRGVNSRKNHHPTVKSLDLMRHLCRLVTPPGGTVLDPFTGSASTGCAALLEGCRFIGIEKDPENAEIARARLHYWSQEGPEYAKTRYKGKPKTKADHLKDRPELEEAPEQVAVPSVIDLLEDW